MPTPPGRTLWPAHPQPFPEELLSSWMVRIARAHGWKPATFWKYQAGGVNFRTVDREPGEALLQLLSAKTGTPMDRVPAAVVWTYAKFGVLRHGWQNGVMVFCPLCLNDGAYFRRRWRLEFFSVCDVHRVRVYDSCPTCRGLVRPELVPLEAESLANCHNCGYDLSKAAAQPLRSERASVVSTK